MGKLTRRQRIGLFIKASFVAVLYRAEISKGEEWHVTQVRYTFKMYPRKIRMGLMLLILTPFAILWGGIISLPKMWKDSYKVQSWSSYEIIRLRSGNVRPTFWECCKKF